jgi:hypothetical protein
MNTAFTTSHDAAKAAKLLEEAEAWEKSQKPRPDPVSEFQKARDALAAKLAELPEKVEIPYDKTPEGERLARFMPVCPAKFHAPVDYKLVKRRAPFDRVLNWDGRFPGPAATGTTGFGKTFASWWALRRLYVKEDRQFAWFPARRLVSELERYETAGHSDEFFRTYDYYHILFVDDIDKINWDFESHAQLLFSFLDWVYRKQKPCILTTNRDRKWWAAKSGDAFVRRLFDDACFEVEFK